ncbi:MAG: hypothetical protein RLZZ324_61 [Candidatus Parcubacteria bacterium]|jgi:uncharacterized membrane protein
MFFHHERNNWEKSVLVLSAIGAGFMAYLLRLHFQDGGSSVCNFGAGFSCEIVNQSAYSTVAGIPVSLLGLTYFAAVFAVTWRNVKDHMRAIQLATLASLVFSFYLSFVEARVLYTFCLFCEASKALMLCILYASFRGTRHAETAVKPEWYALALGCGVAFTWLAMAAQG